MECKWVPPAELWDQLPDHQVERYRNHLKMCRACRRRILQTAPDLLLDQLNSEPMPAEFWLGFWESLDRKLPERTAVKPERQHRNYLPLMPVARWAAVFVAAVLLVLFSHHLPESPSSPRGGQSARPTLLPPAPPAVTAVTAAEIPQPGSSAYPLVEEVQNPKATYYIIEAEKGQKIVMMFDPDMEL